MTSFTDRVAIVATMASTALSTELAPEGWSSEGWHRQLESLRKYERISPVQVEAVSKILSSSEKVNYRSAVEEIQEERQSSSGLARDSKEMVPSPWLPEVKPAVPELPTSMPTRSGIVQYSSCTFNITYNKE